MSSAATHKTGAKVLCETLRELGVDTVFGLPGGAVLPLYDALADCSYLRHVLVRHEQGAAMAADGYARAKGAVGVCIATSGPGATNLVTGIATAMMDSVPMVVITGQVATTVIGTDAFQETDITGVTLGVTKHNYLVTDVNSIKRIVHEAFHIANTGRKGPVLIDVPRNILAQPVDEAELESPEVNIPGYQVPTGATDAELSAAVRLIEGARRPVILSGHGVLLSGATAELAEFAAQSQIPVVTTLLGISSFSATDPLNMGFPGMHGMAYASLALDQADLIISLGSRFDDRVVGDVARFASASKKIHVDIDLAELNKTVKVDLAVNADIKHFLNGLTKQIKPGSYPEWSQHLAELKREHPLTLAADAEHEKSSHLQGQNVIRSLSRLTKGDAIICTGVGQHQMWVAQYYEFTKANSFLTSGGLGAMGYEVPSAMGAQLACPDKAVWSICGDGGFQMTLMELATVVENQLPVKYLILNNNHLGMITQWQNMFYSDHFSADTYTANPDFVALGEAYGVKSYRVKSESELDSTLADAAAHAGPVLVDCVIEKVDNVYPMIPSGQSVQELLEKPLVV